MRQKIFDVYRYPYKPSGIVYEEFDCSCGKNIFIFQESNGSRHFEADSIFSLQIYLWREYPGEEIIFSSSNK
jgi:hypothetical protein